MKHPLAEILNEGGGTLESVRTALSKYPQYVNKPFSVETDNILKEDEGSTPLIWVIDGVHCGLMRGTPDSAFQDQLPLIYYLLSLGADPNVIDNKGLCALDYLEYWPQKYKDLVLTHIKTGIVE